jgi:hypothetical protein
MVTETKTATRHTSETREPTSAQDSKTGYTRLPDMNGWIQKVFYSGAALPATPPVAMLRAMPFPTGLGQMIDSGMQMQAEMARFGAQRVHRALEAQAALLACSSAAERAEVQTSYMHGLVEDYTHEWNRFFADGMRLGAGQPVPAPREPEEKPHATPV